MTAAGAADLVTTDPFPPAPSRAALAELLDRHAPFTTLPLLPELQVFQAAGLMEVWQAADALAGRPVPSPFWAYAWPGGVALARVLLDHPARVRNRAVLDLGCGGGVAALAAARAGAALVVANDVDPWAILTVTLAAERQGLHLETLAADLTERPRLKGFDVVLCGDLCYERGVAPRVRALLQDAADHGALVLLADPGRAYFEPEGLEPIAAFTLPVPPDLEGTAVRRARVFRVPAREGEGGGGPS